MRNMLLQIKNKKGISVMVGYVLLIAAIVAMGALVYTWLRTYVPTPSLECPDGVSIFISDYECSESELNLTLKNNGMFDIAGYFIHASTNESDEIATVDLSSLLSGRGRIAQNAVIFISTENNPMGPNQEMRSTFFGLSGKIYLLEIIPIRFQEENNKLRLVSCGNAKIIEEVECSDSGQGHGW